jgi:VanZ family protein
MGPDKIVHFVFYSVFAFLLFLAIGKQYNYKFNRLNILIAVFLTTTIFGLSLEVLQFYVFIGRSGNFFDFLANMLGALFGVVAFCILNRNKLSKPSVEQ